MTKIDAEERKAREELACLYRVFDKLGWHELIYNHITLRVPGRHDHFLINPFGLMYREITASSLVKIDLRGHAVDGGAFNPAGFVVHAAVHRARPDAACVMHTHTTAGMAVACLADGLQPLGFTAHFYAGRLSYHDFEGITLDEAECDRLAASLGANDAMILRNHGLLACGPTPGDAFAELYHLQRACEVQVAAMATGAPLNVPSTAVQERAAAQFDATARKGGQNELLFGALARWMEDIDPGYRA